MTHRDLILYCLSLGFESLVCVLVYVRGLHRRLPLFAAYASTLLLGSSGILFAYLYFGFRSSGTYYASWIEVGMDAIARSFAIGELCRYGLRAYRGIWALAWRGLTLLAALLVGHAALDAWGQPHWFATYMLTIESDLEFASLIILVALLLIRSYYGLALEPLQVWIAAGILFVCGADVVGYTMMRDFSVAHMSSWNSVTPQVEQATELWNTINMSAFVVSLAIWSLALRKPLPAQVEEPVLLPAGVYDELSPAVNLRLRALNDRLVEMLRT